MQATTIEVTDEFEVAADPGRAWDLLVDPAVVVACMPGAHLTEERPDGSAAGEMRVKLGPTTVVFRGDVAPEYDTDRRAGRIVAQGQDHQGRSRARAVTTFVVEPASSPGLGGSRIAITGTVELIGPLAPFLRTGGTHLTRRLLADFARAFTERCDGPAHEHPEAAQAVSTTATAAGPIVVGGGRGLLQRLWARLRLGRSQRRSTAT